MLVFWVALPCGLAGTYKRFGEIKRSEDGQRVVLPKHWCLPTTQKTNFSFSVMSVLISIFELLFQQIDPHFDIGIHEECVHVYVCLCNMVLCISNHVTKVIIDVISLRITQTYGDL